MTTAAFLTPPNRDLASLAMLPPQPKGAATGVATAGAEASSLVDGGEERFLRLLVAQMKNQNPLSPLDNAELTSQLAQISTVRGIDKLNETIGQLLGGMNESQAMQASSLLGRAVFVAGDTLELGAAGAARAGFELAGAADEVLVTIKDAAGLVVHTAGMGRQPAGQIAFEWDGATDAGGRAVPGSYRFEVNARSGGEQIEATRYSLGTVGGVARGAGGVVLDLGPLGRQPFGAVKQIL